MLTEIIKKSWKPLLYISLVSLITTWIFGITNMLIQTETINGIEIKTFNIRIYMDNISNAWTSNALNFQDILPPVQWQNLNNNPLEAEFWNTILNNLAFIADWAYFPINFILWIFRWICWIIKITLALIGWNTLKNYDTGTYYSQLIEILSWIIEKLMIPYINPN